MLVAGVGVDSEHKRELSPEVLAGAAKVVTDLRGQCAQIGDLHHAIAAGAMTVADVHGDLGEVIAGLRAGRSAEDEVIVRLRSVAEICSSPSAAHSAMCAAEFSPPSPDSRAALRSVPAKLPRLLAAPSFCCARVSLAD